jgi:hypothetical protein
MSFLETPASPGAAPVWATLDETQRAEVVALLARLIAQGAARRSEAAGAQDREKGNE